MAENTSGSKPMRLVLAAKKHTTLIFCKGMLYQKAAWEFGTSLFFNFWSFSVFPGDFPRLQVHICGMPRRLSGLDVNPAKNAGGYKRQPSGG